MHMYGHTWNFRSLKMVKHIGSTITLILGYKIITIPVWLTCVRILLPVVTRPSQSVSLTNKDKGPGCFFLASATWLPGISHLVCGEPLSPREEALPLITTIFFVSKALHKFPWLLLLPLVGCTEGPTSEGNQHTCLLLLGWKLFGNTHPWKGFLFRTRGCKMSFLQPSHLYPALLILFSRPLLWSFLASF